MNYQNPQLLEQLAAQYVLGTLRHRARKRFEKICLTDANARKVVMFWEDRLSSMLSQLEPMTPPKHVWSKIERQLQLGTPVSMSSRLREWLSLWWSGVVLASVLVLVVAVGLIRHLTPVAQEIAVVTQAEQGALWHIKVQRKNQLLIEATALVTEDRAHAYELWALPASGAAPVSLGLLPVTGSVTVELTAAQLVALSHANKVAVSLEPPGGSPTGAPTGPVLHVADLAAAIKIGRAV